MLLITVPETEGYNEITEEFFTYPEVVLELEHSLVSLSKWESKWQKPFISKKVKTTEEILDYISCCSSIEIPKETLSRLSQSHLAQFNDYIGNPMSATTFSEVNQTGTSEVVTAEIIYYWIIAMQIDFRVENWHFNRLMTLIKVVNAKNAPEKQGKPATKSDLQQRAALNAARKRQYQTRG